MATRSQYTYDISAKYISSENKEYDIVKETIEYIMVDHDYENSILPIMVLKLKLSSQLYNMMKVEQDKGRVYLEVNKYCKDNTSTVNTPYVKDQFNFIMREDPNGSKTMDENSETNDPGISFRSTVLGLVKKDLLQKNQKTFNGIYSSTTVKDVVTLAISDINTVVEEPISDEKIETMTVPTIPTVMQFLTYLNNLYNIYNGQFSFFIDLDRSYLKSNSGKAIQANDGQYDIVAIDIRDLSDYSINIPGVVIDQDQKSYILYSSAQDVKLKVDRVSVHGTSELVAVSPDGKMEAAKIDTGGVINEVAGKDSKKFIKTDNPNKSSSIATMIQGDSVYLELTKGEIDATIITPNKQYLVTNFVGNNNYTGVYYLTRKRDIFTNGGVSFNYSCTIGLKMCINYKNDIKRSERSKPAKYKYDIHGNLIDDDGNLIDEYGNRIDEEGNILDDFGNRIDDEEENNYGSEDMEYNENEIDEYNNYDEE